MQLSSNISQLLKTPPSSLIMQEPKKKIPDFLLNDVRNFSRINQNMTSREAAEAFRDKWVGYRAEYSVEFVEMVFKMVIE